MREKLCDLDKNKAVIYGGDLNVAHQEIGAFLRVIVSFLGHLLPDLANPKSNANKTPGFTDQEREDMTQMLDAGFVDTYRNLHNDR